MIPCASEDAIIGREKEREMERDGERDFFQCNLSKQASELEGSKRKGEEYIIILIYCTI